MLIADLQNFAVAVDLLLLSGVWLISNSPRKLRSGEQMFGYCGMKLRCLDASNYF